VTPEVGRMAIDVFPGNIESGLAATYMRIAGEGGVFDIGEVAYGDARIKGFFTV
jgi:hypothetical protein